MLSNLRPGTPVYLFYKNEMRYAAGTVHQVSGQYPAMNYQQPMMPGAGAVVNVTIDVNGKTESYERIPLNTSIAEFPDKGVLISETREGIINERQSVLQQVPTIEQEIKACDNLLIELNPQLKREQEQAGKIASLEKQLAGMSDQIAALTGMLSKTLGKKPKEE